MTHDTTPPSASADTVEVLAAFLGLPPGAELTETGIIKLDAHEHSVETLSRLTSRIAGALVTRAVAGGILRWALADAIIAGLECGEDAYILAVEETGWSFKQLYNMTWMARRIGPDIRKPLDKVSWTHHEIIAGVEPENEKRRWLEYIADATERGEEVSTRQLTQEIKARRDISAGKDPLVEQARRSFVQALNEMTDKLTLDQQVELWRDMLNLAAARRKTTLAELLREIEPTIAGDAAPPRVVPVYQNGREVTGLVM